jgi:hypothetical protein
MKRNEPTKHPLMYVLKAFLVLAVLLTAVAVSAGGRIGDKQQSSVVLTGVVTDTTCGSSHNAGLRGNPECTRDCVSAGAGYALAIGRKVYVLQGHRAALYRFAGEIVIVKGKVRGYDTIVVESVTPAIFEVLRGMPAAEASESTKE